MAAANPDNGGANQRVTLAVLQNDLKHMQAELERRFDTLETKLDGVCDKTDDLGDRVTRNEERIKQTTGFLAILSLIFSTIAGGISAIFRG